MQSPTFSIDRCSPDDAEALALVGGATFLETFAGILDGQAIIRHCAQAHAAATYRGLLADGASIWTATCQPGAAPAGYVVLAPAALPVAPSGGLDLEIKRIYLLHRFQGCGLGRRLLEVAEAEVNRRHARRLLLGVYAGNANAQAFYRRAGFAEIGRRSFTVGGVDYDDVVMSKALAG